MKTEKELRAEYLAKADMIFIRENIGHGWMSYALSELPPDVAEKHLARWIEARRQAGELSEEAPAPSPRSFFDEKAELDRILDKANEGCAPPQPSNRGEMP